MEIHLYVNIAATIVTYVILEASTITGKSTMITMATTTKTTATIEGFVSFITIFVIV